jgi:L-asparaginase II
MGYIPVLEVTRGDVVESIHFGAVAVADPQGKLHAWLGDPATVTYLRSSAKPFQILPLLESGAARKYGFTPRQIAIISASHTGTDDHVAVVQSVQELAGINEADLLCGTHPPDDIETARRLRAAGLQPTPLRHNCSGKHSGMLALARFLGEPTEDYVNPDHPVQRRILSTFAEMVGLQPDDVHVGIDGCSAPNFAVPLQSAATALARLAAPSGLGEVRREACHAVFDSMAAHPDMVRGPGEFDTLLMQTGGGRVVSKSGAEGYYALALRPGAAWTGSPALGIAAKVSDGDLGRRVDNPPGNRAGCRMVLEILAQLGAWTPEQTRAMSAFGPASVTNKRMLKVGEMRTCFWLVRG